MEVSRQFSDKIIFAVNWCALRKSGHIPPTRLLVALLA